ncbi:nucleolar complex-associated protein 3 [Fistulina hepatica ATCC 64428]|nr:nucleolar complex-associated protein 3 [Fistulina hepatica ATCC 64428]
MGKPNNKRSGPSLPGPSKKRKITNAQPNAAKPPRHRSKSEKKEKAADRKFIPIPDADDGDSDTKLSDQDIEAVEEYGNSMAFLGRLDKIAISRSKKEIMRLHEQTKLIRKRRQTDDLPSMNSDDDDNDDYESWSSGIEGMSDLDDHGPAASADEDSLDDPDTEMPYETVPRKLDASWKPQKDGTIAHLPIKLANGVVQGTGRQRAPFPGDDAEDSTESEESAVAEETQPHVEDVATGARFGRPAVTDVIGQSSRKARIQHAKNQIASICQDIVCDLENSLGLLRRLHSFSLSEISTPARPEPVKNDPLIRRLSILSQLAVFKDIVPGYRIRELTEKEKAEKVSQQVARTREWEQGLVGVYQSYLQLLEAELKARSELAQDALRCMCTLLQAVTHFNFRTNLMNCVVTWLSKKSWDSASDLCLDTIIKVFRADLTGEASLELVRLLNRMIKEKHFNIHPNVLSCLLHLRLMRELGIRASESQVDKEAPAKTMSKGRSAARRAKGRRTEQPHLSKKARKELKEKEEIQKEYREAEADVDKEERASRQTETLKLLFVIYFRILKNPEPTPLLPAALRGVAKFAHMVNIDFFRDLMQVLKDLMAREDDDEDNPVLDGSRERAISAVHLRLLCVVTAFELLSGQGEALNIDLTAFLCRLYSLIMPLSLMPDIDAQLPPSRDLRRASIADMLFRALDIAFQPRGSGSTGSERSAAFAKRLLTAALNWPPAVVVRTLDFIEKRLIAKQPKLLAMLLSDDDDDGGGGGGGRALSSGTYRPDIDDPDLANPFATSFWEVRQLATSHWHADVRARAQKLFNMVART